MSRFTNNLISSTIFILFNSSSLVAAPGDIFDITEFNFSLSCTNAPELSNPQFPDSNVQNITPVSGAKFVDGEYAGEIPISSADEDAVETYVKFEYIGAPVSNYTAPTGIDGLNHPPPSFDLNNLTANLSSFYAYWNGTEFNQGNANVKLIDNLDTTYTVDYRSLISGLPFDGCTGRWKFELNCRDCEVSQLGISPTLTTIQNHSTTRTVTIADGTTVISSTLGDAPSGYVFSWTPSDNTIIDTDTVPGTFTFNPDSLTPGSYVFTMVYINNNTTPITKGRSKITINVVSSTTGDMHDDNNNGIPNVDDDPSLSASQLMTEAGNSNSFILQTNSGSLKLGQTAFCSNNAARISSDDITNFGSSDCGSVTNNDDSEIKATGIGGYFDFEVHDLTKGETIQVIIPLTTEIPFHATYRKYYTNSGWAIFETTNSDNLSSSNSFSSGICPAPGSSAYIPGLNAGHDCVQLTITDGGPNDIDGAANGVIIDPGAIAEIQSGVEANLSSGCTISSQTKSINQHLEWLLIVIFIGLLGFINRIKSNK